MQAAGSIRKLERQRKRTTGSWSASSSQAGENFSYTTHRAARHA